jgi:hypothetical protein
MLKHLVMAAAVGLSGTAVMATTVDLELVLVTDVSGSVDATDYNLIRNGYAAAFRDAGLIDTILNGAIGKIAVQVVHFGSSATVALDGAWTIIDSVASSEAFADALETMTRVNGGSTNIVSGMVAATAAFANDIESTRQVIDFAIDGNDNVNCGQSQAICGPVQDARDAAIVAGVDAINALLINDRDFFGDDPADSVKATPYAQNNMIAGPGSFANLIEGFEDFETAIKSKLVREIKPPGPTPIPLPAAGWLLIAGLAGLGALARRRAAA